MKKIIFTIFLMLIYVNVEGSIENSFKVSDGSDISGFTIMDGSTDRAYCLLPANYEDGRNPFVIVCPGLGGTKEQMWGTSMTLARNGYIVIAITPPGISLDGIRPIEYVLNLFKWNLEFIWALDYVLRDSPLSEFIDSERIACVGHSWGGMTSVIVSCMDSRVKTIVLLSPASFLSKLGDISVPTIIFTGAGDFQQPAANNQLYPGIKAPKMIVNLTNGAKHGCFIGREGCENWVMEITSVYYLAWLDYFLNDNESALDILTQGSLYLDPEMPSYINLDGEDERILPTYNAE